VTHPDTPTSGAPTAPAPETVRGGRRAPRRTRAEAKRLDELRGGDHAGPKLAELLAGGEWQPEFLLVQRVGPLVDYRKAGERALNKYIANRRGRMPDAQAKAEATEQYHGNPEKARRYGQKLIVLQLLGGAAYESRRIAEGRYAGEREWRLRPPALRRRRRSSSPVPSSPPAAEIAAERMVQAWADTAAAARAAAGDVITPAELDRLVAADEQGGYKAVRVLARKLGIKEKPAQDAVRVAKAQRPGGVNDAWVPGYQRKSGSWVRGHWARRHSARFPGADAAALALGDALDAGTYDAVLPELVARATARLAFLEARRRANGVSSAHEPDSAPQAPEAQEGAGAGGADGAAQ